MSRSYHSNVRKYIREKSYKYSDEGIKEKNLDEIGEELYRKNFTKKKTILNRRSGNISSDFRQPVDVATLEIRVLDEGQYIHYPASKEDLIGVIKRLPYNVVSGIRSINLCLGKEFQEDNEDNLDDVKRDPFTGRISTGDEGPIYTPSTLGTYYPGRCKIFIYGYVYDREELKLQVMEPFLRLQMLSTLIHEIAHHEDNLLRTRRGRWLGFNKWRCEDYAELQQMKWSETAIIPYVMEAYPEEYIALSDWIEKYGGVRFSLEKLAGEPTGRKIGDRVKYVFTASSAVEDLFNNIIKGMNERDAMLEFAKDLHYGYYFEECLKALNTLLINNPNDSGALGVMADTYIHQEEYSKAEEAAKKCLSIDKNNRDALEALCDVRQNMKDWKGLKEISKLGIEVSGDEVHRLRAFTEMNIIALLYLKENEEAEEALLHFQNKGLHKQRKLAFEALVKVCSGDLENAFSIADKVLVEEKVFGPAGAILKAIYNYVLVNDKGEKEKYTLSKNEQYYLRNTDIMGLL